MESQQPLKVAVVGVGPKGLYCLERLVARAAGRLHRRGLELDLFEPTGEFGAGAVYAGGQAPYLSMNFADRLIDAWPAAGPVSVPLAARRSYAEWLADRGEDQSRRNGPLADGYSPRTTVGEYLRECFELVCRSLPPGVAVRRRTERVERVVLEDGHWRLSADGGPYDEVLIATGHARKPATPVGYAVDYPLNGELSPESMPPGSSFAVRGMALTSIDVALALTEGRRGRFRPDRSARTGLRYEPSGQEVRTLTLGSRTGRPMLVKPDPGRFGTDSAVAEVAARGRERLAACPYPDPDAVLISELAWTGAELLGAVNGREAIALDQVRPAVAGALLGRLTTSAFEPPAMAVESLRQSLEVALGERPPDVLWALGEAWRSLYPAIVACVSHGGLAPEAWPRFAALAREMERIAFGPPPSTAAKLLTLIDAGVVRLAPTPMGSGGETAEIDAVLAPPGAGDLAYAPLSGLLANGHVRLAPGGRRGIEIDEAAGCVGTDGTPSPGLSAVGRMTEDWVIGNDTLSRRLHDHPDRWAQKVATRL
jgi:uncharacterized NAD(P)/FAD-binding protein YdhS